MICGWTETDEAPALLGSILTGKWTGNGKQQRTEPESGMAVTGERVKPQLSSAGGTGEASL